MTVAFDYSGRYEPPTPVLSVLVGAPGRAAPGVLVEAVVDTGADRTVVPAWLPGALGLHPADALEVRTPAGRARAPVHVVRLRAPGVELTLHVLALGDEALLGRDVLSGWVLTLDGPAGRLEIAAP